MVSLSFGFSTAHFRFALLFAASDICFHISGHNLSGLQVVCFLVSLSLEHVYPFGGFSLNVASLVKPIHVSDTISINIPEIVNISLQHHIQCCVTSSGNVNVFQWNGA